MSTCTTKQPSYKPTDESEPELRQPHEWCSKHGVLVLDPDGWRTDGKSFFTPITEDEWWERLIPSTIQTTSKTFFERLRRYGQKLDREAAPKEARANEDLNSGHWRVTDKPETVESSLQWKGRITATVNEAAPPPYDAKAVQAAAAPSFGFTELRATMQKASDINQATDYGRFRSAVLTRHLLNRARKQPDTDNGRVKEPFFYFQRMWTLKDWEPVEVFYGERSGAFADLLYYFDGDNRLQHFCSYASTFWKTKRDLINWLIESKTAALVVLLDDLKKLHNDRANA